MIRERAKDRSGFAGIDFCGGIYPLITSVRDGWQTNKEDPLPMGLSLYVMRGDFFARRCAESGGESRLVEGQVRRSKKVLSIRGLNKGHNHDLKGLFKGAATTASTRPGPFQDFYQAALAKGTKPTRARLTLVRKIAAITLDSVEEGRELRRRKTKIASRLNVGVSTSLRPLFAKQMTVTTIFH